jgi:hypothetical protein
MKNGLTTTLFAVAASIAGISSSYAAAPVISNLPDITIGDKEEMDAGGTDSNFFVYTNAFRFADHVSDSDSDEATLIWTFMEGNNPGSGNIASQYFTVNDKPPVAVGDDQIANVNPDVFIAPANDVATSEWAMFRNIVFSPQGETAPFPAPATRGATVEAQHATGKIVTFVVADESGNTDTDSILVKTIDNVNDAASAVVTSPYVKYVDNQFTTGSLGWSPTIASPAAGQSTSWNAANTALHATINATAASSRIIGWLESNAADDTSGAPHLKFSQVPAGNIIRAKFHVYATGQTGAGNKNQIPNIRMRVGSRFGYGVMLDVLHSTPGDPEGTAKAIDLAASPDNANPTVHRVDLVRPNLPFYATTAGLNEGVQRTFETFATGSEPDQNGTIGLTESSVGAYAAPVISDDPSVLKKVYNPADLNNAATRNYSFRQLERGPALTLLTMNSNGDNAGGSFGGQSWTGVPAGEITITANGSNSPMAISTAGTADTKIAVATVDYLQGTTADISNHTGRLRADTDKIYHVRFFATATGASSDNAMIRFRVRTAKFAYGARLEVGNPWNITAGRDATRASNIIGIQSLPGTGGSAGPFDLIMVSPLTSSRNVPSLQAEDGPGAGPATRTTASRRDILPGVDIIDSFGNSFFQAGTADQQEKGNVTVSKIEIREYPSPLD